jgi:hypothetical protein
MVFTGNLRIDAPDRTLAHIPYAVHAKRTYANASSNWYTGWCHVHRAEYAYAML